MRLVLLLVLCLFLKLLHASPFPNTTNLLCTELLNVQLMENCCGRGVPSKLLILSSNCEQHKTDVCRYECAFKHYQLLDNENELLMPNVSSMIRQLYSRESSYNVYGDLLLMAFYRCHRLANSFTGLTRMYATLAELDQNYGQVLVSKCHNKGLIYARCAIANVFLKCPLAYWQYEIEDCSASRRLLEHCVSFLREMDIEKSDEITHSASESYHILSKRSQKAVYWYTAFINWLVF